MTLSFGLSSLGISVAIFAASMVPTAAHADVITFGQGVCSCNGVAVDSTGAVYGADPIAHQVVKLSAAGSVLGRWGTYGPGNGQFEDPRGLAIDSRNNVYVADTQRFDVQEFSSGGSYIQKFAPPYWVVNGPHAVAIDPSGNVYIGGGGPDIYKYNSSGTLLSTWQSGVGGNPSFNYIASIAYNPANGNIYALDVWNAPKVLDFTPAGKFVASWGSSGTSPGELDNPSGLATDQTGNLYISQPGATNASQVIQKFTAAGTFISSYTPSGSPKAITFMAPDLYAAEGSGFSRINLTAPIPSLSVSNGEPLTSRTVTFDGSGSSLPFGQITDYKWDLDGSGHFATDTGPSPNASHVFTTPGPKAVSLRVTGSSGETATTNISFTVVPTPPPGRVGVCIDQCAYATNTPNVSVNIIWPVGATHALVSNDGGFNAAGGTRIVALAPSIAWRLRSRGNQFLPKIVYVRFTDGPTGLETFTDDILLDTRIPTVRSAAVVGAARDATLGDHAFSASSQTYGVRLRATEPLSGISRVEFSRRPTHRRLRWLQGDLFAPFAGLASSSDVVVPLRNPKQPGIRNLNKVFSVTMSAPPLWVRVQSAAGNWSSWHRIG